MEIDYANGLGATGRNLRHNDCEYCWIWDHEDITVAQESGFPCHSAALQYADHGTASSGCAVGRDNGFGILGASIHAAAFGFSEYTTAGYNRPRSVTAAARNSRAGDIMLLEMQNLCCGQTGSNYSPAETDAAVFQASRTAVDAGVVVIAAAGNGNQNLDGTPYATWRGWGDSGAVIIGAGVASTAHNRASFSSFGARVNVQAWGDWSVMTGGYGPPPVRFPGDTTRSRLYTATFSGTSSASALSAAAATSLQSYAITRSGRPLTSVAMRTLLMNTGVPQTGTPTGNIGPHINLRRAFAQM
jgi:subtilisin family serine protease